MSDPEDATSPGPSREPRWRRADKAGSPQRSSSTLSHSAPRVIQVARTTPQVRTFPAPPAPPASAPGEVVNAPEVPGGSAGGVAVDVAHPGDADPEPPELHAEQDQLYDAGAVDGGGDDVVTVSPDPVGVQGPLRPPVPIETERRPRTWLWMVIGVVAVAAISSLLVLPQLGKSDTTTESFGEGQTDQSTAPVETTTTTVVPTTTPKPPAPVVHRIQTTDPVVFITIDDGWTVTPDVFDQLATGKLPATAFPITDVIQKHQDQWKPVSQHVPVENHSNSHPRLDKMPLAAQQAEICSASEKIQAITGKFPTILRAPYGALNADTQAAAGLCGISFIAAWSVEVRQGKFHWMDHPQGLVPGDIILFHFRPELNQDLALALAAAQAAGLHPAMLTDYLDPAKGVPTTTTTAPPPGASPSSTTSSSAPPMTTPD